MKKISHKYLFTFTEKYIRDTFQLHSILFEYPKVYIRFSILTLFLRPIHPKLLVLILKIILNKNKRNNKNKIIIYEASQTREYIKILKKNNINFSIIDRKMVLALKFCSYKLLCKSRSTVNNIENILLPIIRYFNEREESPILILPNDTYPDTFLLTQICREFCNCKTICIQHGSPARIYMNLNNLKSTLWDGLNSDIFLAWDNYSRDLIQLLLEKSNLPINKKLKVEILNSLPIIQGFRKTLVDNRLTKEIRKYSILIVEDCTDFIYFDKKSYFNKFTMRLSESTFLNKFKEHIDNKILFKPYNNKTKNIPQNTNEKYTLVKSKEDLFKGDRNLICFCGVTTLAFELRVAGNFVIGIDGQNFGRESFPLEIYNEYINITNSNNLLSIEKIINKFLIEKHKDNNKFENLIDFESAITKLIKNY